MSSISSVAAPPPLQMPEPAAPKAPDVTPGADSSAPQPVVLTPLPPGQGTRVNQLC